LARKKEQARKSQTSSNKNSRKTLAVAIALIAALGIGLGSLWVGDGGEAPPTITSDGRVVILEFFDFG
jgi:uncharacterized protein HemX